ncbi:MAG: hypothetical protein II863_11000 [Kiritimatiellae bacterium]|nr:hypothetical protein [Kiritimatiellia bacterium]
MILWKCGWATLTLALATLTLALAAPLCSVAAIDGFDADGLPYAKEGFGVRRNFYQSGRISAKVSDIAGIFGLNYVGAQPFKKQTFYRSASENCHWMHGFDPYVLIDDVPYRLTFANTKHYPFGYTSECTVDGVKLRHEFVLDRNVAFRRITVLENPKGKSVRCRIVQMQAGMGQGARWRVESEKLKVESVKCKVAGCGRKLVAEAEFEDGVKVSMEIGAANPVSFPLNDRPPQPLAYRQGDGRPDFRFDMDETEPGERHLFWWAFDAKDGEDFSGTRVDRVFAEFRERHAADARFETGDALVDGWLGYVAPMSAAFEVDGIGAFRASPTYWVWGWDAMVHAGTLAACGRAAEVKRMLKFFRDTASEEAGILHAYGTSFRFEGPGSGEPGGSYTMPPAVQLFWTILLNDYVNATGDEAFKAECLPFARKLVERAKASADAEDLLPHASGFYPDNPYAVDQRPDDIALINCAIYWQGLKAWEELSGEGAAEIEAVARSVASKLWNAEKGWWADSWDVADGCRREHCPLYGFFHVSPFARDIYGQIDGGSDVAARTAGFLRREFFMGDRLVMFGWRTKGWCADGNQLGSYYPVTDRTYWNAMNAAGRTDAIAGFRNIVARHARVLTYPEGQTADAFNLDPSDSSDELGNKQFFAAKGWLADALDLWLGMRVSKDGLRFRPMNDGRAFAVRGLSLRGTTLDIEMSGAGPSARFALDGETVPDGFIPWAKLRHGRNLLAITLIGDTAK